jgi:hypothetical protein
LEAQRRLLREPSAAFVFAQSGTRHLCQP